MHHEGKKSHAMFRSIFIFAGEVFREIWNSEIILGKPKTEISENYPRNHRTISHR